MWQRSFHGLAVFLNWCTCVMNEQTCLRRAFLSLLLKKTDWRNNSFYIHTPSSVHVHPAMAQMTSFGYISKTVSNSQQLAVFVGNFRQSSQTLFAAASQFFVNIEVVAKGHASVKLLFFT